MAAAPRTSPISDVTAPLYLVVTRLPLQFLTLNQQLAGVPEHVCPPVVYIVPLQHFPDVLLAPQTHDVSAFPSLLLTSL